MKTYTAIALLSLLGITLSASVALASQSPAEPIETVTPQYMLSAQTQQRRERAPSRFRASKRRNFMESNIY
jgi:hypothetical protein